MSRRIKLTQGKYALVDDELYNWLNGYKWHTITAGNNYYAMRTTPKYEGREPVLMHRQILGLKYLDGKTSAHLNNNGLDNRLSNLKIIKNTGDV